MFEIGKEKFKALYGYDEEGRKQFSGGGWLGLQYMEWRKWEDYGIKEIIQGIEDH